MDKKEKAIRILTEKARELNRIPVRSDFDINDIVYVKSIFGPFPRALEAAGLKKISRRRADKLKRKKMKRNKAEN